MPPDREMLVCAAAIAICILGMKLVGDNAEFIDGKLAPYFVKPAIDDIEIDLVQHVEQCRTRAAAQPAAAAAQPAAADSARAKVQMPMRSSTRSIRGDEIDDALATGVYHGPLLCRHLHIVPGADTTLAFASCGHSHAFHAGQIANLPVVVSGRGAPPPHARRRRHTKRRGGGLPALLPLYLLAVARARAARSDRIGWVAIMQSVCSHVVGIGFLYHRPSIQRIGRGNCERSSHGAQARRSGRNMVVGHPYLWAAFKAAAFLAIEYNSLKMRVAASRRGDSSLTTAERMAIHEQLQPSACHRHLRS